MRQRRVPVRTCVACKTSSAKKSLIRIVRTAAGEVVIDLSGKLPGRGAYLCPSAECVRRAVREKRLSRALRAQIAEDLVRQLEEIVRQGSEDV